MKLNWTGDFSYEEGKIATLKDQVENAIKVIEINVNLLKCCWQDDKSEAYLNAFSEDLSSLKQKNVECQQNVEQYLNEINTILNIYH